MTPLWTVQNDQGNVWHQTQVTIKVPYVFNIVIAGFIPRSAQGDMAIDDVTILNTACNAIPPSTTPKPSVITTPSPYPQTALDCNFERGTCAWIQDTHDDFNWLLHRGSTGSIGTGPVSDHTLNNRNGQYAYIEDSNKRANSSARLISPMVNIQRSGICMKFWYNMHGASVNTLSLKHRTSGVVASTTHWIRAGNQGVGWKYAQVDMKNLGRVQVVFEGLAGPSYTGDIALDDVKMNVGNCPYDGTCDFENGLCGYSQSVSDNFDWRVNTGNTTSVRTGPPADHTFGTTLGHYIYIEASRPRRQGDRARLDSSLMAATTQGSCLKFWYNMNGINMGRLNVYVKPTTLSPSSGMVWSSSGNQGPNWAMALVTIRASSSYRLSFEGMFITFILITAYVKPICLKVLNIYFKSLVYFTMYNLKIHMISCIMISVISLMVLKVNS